MCRNIKTLFNFEPPVTDDEIRAASLQFVRKLSGFTKPSKANEAAFERAVDETSEVARTLLRSLVTNASPRDRELEAAKAPRGRPPDSRARRRPSTPGASVPRGSRGPRSARAGSASSGPFRSASSTESASMT